MTPPSPLSNAEEDRPAFSTTHWSVVWRARHHDPDAAASAEAREKLCRTYWPPLYAYLRRAGCSVHDAQDLTQEFLSRFLHKEWLNHLQDQRGKFRSFLLTFLKHFLSEERSKAHAQKRGGGQPVISLDDFETEEQAGLEPQDNLSPDQLYDRRWARAVMDEAARRLREEFAQRGKIELFDQLKDLHPGEHSTQSYAQIGLVLGLTEQAIKNAVHSFRRRYGELVRDEIAQTVEDPAEVEPEVQHLKQIFAR